MMEHRINAPQRNWSFPWETQTGWPLCWHNGVFEPVPSLLGAVLASCRGQALRSLATSKPQELQPCQCLNRFPAPSGLCHPPQPHISRLPPVLGISGQRRPSQGSCWRTWHLGRPGPARWWPHRPAQLPTRSLPKHLSGVACLAPSEQHYPIASRFIRRLGAERA